MMMLVGVFVHITEALSVEGVQKHMLYYISEKAVKEYILVYLPMIELVFVCMIYLVSSSGPRHIPLLFILATQTQNEHSCVFTFLAVCLQVKPIKDCCFPTPHPNFVSMQTLIADN